MVASESIKRTDIRCVFFVCTFLYKGEAVEEKDAGMPCVAVIALMLLLLGGCSRLQLMFVDEPVVAGVDIADQDVAWHLQEVLQSARALPKSGFARGELAMAYDVNGFREAAVATYEQAEALDPTDFRWPYFRAQLIAETGEYERALEVLGRAIQIDAGYVPARLSQGTWLLAAGHPDDAMIAFAEAQRLAPGPAVTFGRARVMVARGEMAAAVELLQPLAEATQHPYVFRILGEALRGQGRIDEARVALAMGKDALPVNWPDERRDQRNVHVRGHASYELAQAISAEGRFNEVVGILERLQEHHPEAQCGQQQDFFFACNLMNSFAIAYDRAGLPSRALHTVQRGLTLKGTFIPFHLTSANLYRHQGDLPGALSHVEQAIALNPALGYAHEQRGRLLFGLKRFADAEAAFTTALQYEPEKRTTLFYLGLTEVELRRWPAAAERFGGVVRIDPNFAPGYSFLARSLAETGRLAAARQAQLDARRYGADAEELRLTEIRLRQLEAAGE